jgi:hypothetical protein
VLRSNSKRRNETLNEPLINDRSAAHPASRKRKTDMPTKGQSSKLGVRVLRSASKMDTCVEALNVSIPVQPGVWKKSDRKEGSPKDLSFFYKGNFIDLGLS